MTFFNPQAFNKEQAESDASGFTIEAGQYRAVITKCEAKNDVTGENSKYAGKQYSYVQFEADVLVDGRAIPFSERFMIGHEMQATDSFKGLVARGQLNFFNLLEVFNLHTQVIDANDYPRHFVSQNVIIDIGKKKKADNFPNYVKGFAPAGGEAQVTTQAQQTANMQTTGGFQQQGSNTIAANPFANA